MTVVRRNPSSPFFPDWLDDFFSGEINPLAKSRTLTVPPVNVFETDTSYKIELASPGLKKEDIKINLDNDILTISAENEEKEISNEGNFTKREYNYFNFSRSFTLPDSADREKIEAKSKDGVLIITINKKEEVIKKPKQIAIK